MNDTEIVAMHNRNVLDAWDAVSNGTSDMRMNLIWLVNVSESWVDQSIMETDVQETLETV